MTNPTPQDEADRVATDGGCTADALGEAAARLSVRYVLLGRFDGQRLDEQEGYAQGVVAEVAAAAGAAEGRRQERSRARGRARPPAEWRRRVMALADLDSVIVDKNEGPGERPMQVPPAVVA
jgi:hypothetical protein